MRRDHHGDALIGQRRDAPPEGTPRERVGPAGRLIEEQDARLVQQRRRHGEALLEAARQIGGRARGLRELELAQCPVDTRAPCRPAQAVGAGEELQVLPRAERAVQRELLRHITELRARGIAGGSEVHPADAQHPRARGEQSAEHAKRGGLARPVRPEQPEDLAPRDVEAHPIDGREAPEALDQIGHLDDRTARGRRRVRKHDLPAPLGRERAPQQHHEPILEARRDRGAAGGHGAFGLRPHAADRTGVRDGIDQRVRGKQARLQPAGIVRRDRPQRKGAARGESGDRLGGVLGQHPPALQNDHPVCALGFV